MSLRIRRTASRKSQLIVTLFAAFALGIQPLYGLMQMGVAHALTGGATQIVFTTPEQNVVENATTNKISVELRDGTGSSAILANSATLTVTSDSPTATFSSDGSTGWQQPTNYTIQQSDDFYYRDSTVGHHHITVTASGGDLVSPLSASQQVTVTLPTPSSPSPVSGAIVRGDGLVNDWSDVADATQYVYQKFNFDGNGNCDLSNQRGNDQVVTESHSDVMNETQSYCWRVMAKNVLGTSEWSEAWRVIVDRDGPIISINPIGTVGGKDTNGNDVNSVAFTGSINDQNGISGYSYQLLDASGTVLKGPVSVSGAPADATLGVFDISSYEGSFTIRLTATDIAGNSVTVAQPFVIDRTAPDLTAQIMSSSSFMASTEPIVLQGTVGSDFKTFALVRDNSEKTVDLTGSVDANGNWTYIIPKDKVEQGSYAFSVIATDELGNARTVSLSPIFVSAFVPGMGSAIPTDLTKSLADSFIVPRPLTSSTKPTFTAPSYSASDKAVLGTQTVKDSSDAGNLSPVATTAEGWKFFGIAWYWWTLIAVGVGWASWWTFTTFRRKAELV